MTFTAYVNQENPVRQHSVEVTKKDIVAIWNTYNGTREVGLYVGSTYHVYHIKKDSRWMYGMDEDGNPQEISCFKYID